MFSFNTESKPIVVIMDLHRALETLVLINQNMFTKGNFPGYKSTTCRLIQSMPLNKACGLDGISCRLLKEAAPVITTSLTYIINLSIRSGIFPDDWKIARVSPVFKEDIKSDPNNYRPISVLPIVSKLIERIVFNQLYSFLVENDLLADSQP